MTEILSSAISIPAIAPAPPDDRAPAAGREAGRAAHLQELTAALGATLTAEEVAAVVLERARPALGAAGGLVNLLSEDGREFVSLRAEGFGDEMLAPWRRYPVQSGTPGGDLVRTREGVFVSGFAEWRRRYPPLAPLRLAPVLEAHGYPASAALPLELEGRVLGLVALNFATERSFPPEERAMMMAFARQCAQAIERARLFAAERNARAEAERAREQLSDVLESMSDAFYAFDHEWRFVRLNRAARERARSLGSDPAALPGRVLWEDSPRLLGTRVEEGLRRAARERVPLRLEERNPRDGRWHEVHVYPTAEGVAAYTRDVTERRQSDEALRASEARLRQAVLVSPHPVMLSAGDGEVLQLSRSWCALTGWAPEEIPTTGAWTRLAYGGAHAQVDAFLAAEFERWEPHDAGEWEVATRDGGRRIWEFHNVPAGTLPDGRRVLLSTAVDVTERRRQEEEARFLAEAGRALGASLEVGETLTALARLCVPALGDFCVVDLLDEDEVLRRVAARFGTPALEAVHRELRERFPVSGSPRHPARRVVETGEPLLLPDVPAALPGLAGSEEEAELMRRVAATSALVVPLRGVSGRVLGALSLGATGTRRRHDERDLALAAELGRRAGAAVENARAHAAARRARDEAEAANRAKMDFLAVMSHELRTPLNAIAGYAELMEMELHGPLTPEQRADLERIQRSGRHLLSLINDVLNFARLEAGRVEYHLEPVRLHDTVAAVEALVAPQLLARRLHYAHEGCDADTRVLADPEKLRQVLLNLMSNAVKYTEPGGRITVRCERDGAVARVRVADTGAGIPRDRIEQVFEPFVQLDRSLTRTREGTGLGLAISRDLARGMGGELTCESEVGKGSTFTLTLSSA